MRVISFYTMGDGSSYESEATLLRESLEQLRIPHEIVALPDMGGGWYAATAHKAFFIHEMLQKYEGPLLWIDADAYVHQDPTPYFNKLATEGYDFGAHFFQGPAKGCDTTKIADEGWRLLSGTTWWGDTPMARKLADAWVEMNATFKRVGIPEGGGQKNLWYLTTCLAKQKPPLKIARLPGRYTFVCDKPFAYPHKFRDGGRGGCQMCGLDCSHSIHTGRDEPRIIEHTIASRDHRDPSKTKKDRSRGQRIEQLKELG